jgi:hypothetical protein
MKLIKGLLDYSTPWTLPNVYLFTGNPISRKDGALVMGRGAAKQLRDAYPALQFGLGETLRRNPERRLLFVPVDRATDQWIGWFKVKHHWADPADISLIKQSTHELRVVAMRRPKRTFHMNYPGIGNGRLDIDTVHPLLQALPDNVLIYSTLDPTGRKQ